MKISGKVGWRAQWTVYKWGKDPEDRIAQFLQNGGSAEDAKTLFRMEPTVESFEHNVALNEGLQELIDVICGLGTPTKWDNTNARLGVGNGTATADPTQTALQGTSKTFEAMDSGYPQRTNQTAKWRSTFGTGDANYAWEEYTVVNAADDAGKNLNRKVESKGTKSAGETWTLELQVTFS